MTYFLGIDTSTTGSKALIIDERGHVVAAASSPHTIQRPKPLWSEQDPQEWWRAGCASIRAVLDLAGIRGASIGAVGLTGQMHGLVLLDEVGECSAAGNPVERPAHTGAMRRDPRPYRKGTFHPDHRKRRVDRIYGAEDPVGEGKRTRRICQGSPHATAQGLHPVPTDRSICHGQSGWRRHGAVRLEEARLVAGCARNIGNRHCVDAEDLRRS